MATTQPTQGKSIPITPDQALQELSGAGTVAGLAQQAMLDHLGRVTAAKAVRLNREVLRLGQKLGPNAPETQAAVARRDAQATFVTAVAGEQARAAVPVPPLDPKAAIVYGRVLGESGPTPHAIVEAFATADQRSLGRTTTDASGVYQLALPIEAGTAVHLQVRGADQQQARLADSGTLTLSPGTRAYREIVLPAAAPKPPHPGGASSLTMPNLVGMTDARALELLNSLGIGGATIQRQIADTPAGQVIAQQPAPNQPIEVGASVTLTISAGTLVQVPNLVGMSGAEAAVVLNRLGLSLGSIEGDQATGKISRQKPAAGERVIAGSAVDVVFSQG